LPASKRYRAWQDAICEIYLRVDCTAEERADYLGFVREARFGKVVLTDTFSSPQVVLRRNRHIAQLDKDCYIVGIGQWGRGRFCQGDTSYNLDPSHAGVFYACEPYDLRGKIPVRAFWIELPREAFDSRFQSGRAPLNARLNIDRGLGRITAELCRTMASEGADVDADVRSRLGDEFMDILALALEANHDGEPAADRAIRHARLRSVKAYIDAHLREPGLTLDAIARSNGISLRYLHELFRALDTSVSEWIWQRRLQKCHELLSCPEHAGQSITEIAFSMGFNSSSHFSNRFREEFGVRPSDVRGATSSSRDRAQ